MRKNKTTFSDYSLPAEIFWKLFVIGKRPLGAFHSTKTSSVNFRQLPVASGTASSKSSKTEDDLATNTQIFGKFFPGNFLSIQLSSRNFWLNCLHFENSPVSGISGNFSQKFLYHLPLFPNFRKFWLNGKRSMLPTLILDLLKLSSIYTSNYLWPITKRAEIQMDPSDIKSNTLVWSKHRKARVTNSRLAVIGFGVSGFGCEIGAKFFIQWISKANQSIRSSPQPFCRLCGETQLSLTCSFRHVTKL